MHGREAEHLPAARQAKAHEGEDEEEEEAFSDVDALADEDESDPAEAAAAQMTPGSGRRPNSAAHAVAGKRVSAEEHSSGLDEPSGARCACCIGSCCLQVVIGNHHAVPTASMSCPGCGIPGGACYNRQGRLAQAQRRFSRLGCAAA